MPVLKEYLWWAVVLTDVWLDREDGTMVTEPQHLFHHTPSLKQLGHLTLATLLSDVPSMFLSLCFIAV